MGVLEQQQEALQARVVQLEQQLAALQAQLALEQQQKEAPQSRVRGRAGRGVRELVATHSFTSMQVHTHLSIFNMIYSMPLLYFAFRIPLYIDGHNHYHACMHAYMWNSIITEFYLGPRFTSLVTHTCSSWFYSCWQLVLLMHTCSSWFYFSCSHRVGWAPFLLN